MSEAGTTTIVVLWLSAALFSAYVAAEKNRNPWLWTVLGLAFGVVALIAVAGVPPVTEEEWKAQHPQRSVREKLAGRARPWNPMAGPPPSDEPS